VIIKIKETIKETAEALLQAMSQNIPGRTM
jgi:hypothetical protein